MTSLCEIELRLGEEAAFAIFSLPPTQTLRRDATAQTEEVKIKRGIAGSD